MWISPGTQDGIKSWRVIGSPKKGELHRCNRKEQKGEQMEKKFGIFKTVEELNRAAAAQKAEGDEEALIALAIENGLDREDAEDYMDGAMDKLCTPYMAAIAKLNSEAKELELKSQLLDWKDYLIQIMTEYQGDELNNAVFDPDKKLLDVMAKGMKLSSENRIQVDKRIIKAAGLPDSAAYIGMCGRDDLRQIIMSYYLEGAE